MIIICVQKHQGESQKLMIGWHKHQGVSETPKNAIICEQPLKHFSPDLDSYLQILQAFSFKDLC